MKKLLALLLLFPLFLNARKLYPGKNDGDGYFTVLGQDLPAVAGDTIVFIAGVTRTYFSMTNYEGTAANPIVIINEGGVAYFSRGMGFQNCRYIKILGGTVPGFPRGFHFAGLREGIDAGANQGVNILGRSSDITVEDVEISRGTYGIEAKNDPTCDATITNWVMKNLHFRRLYIHNTGSQGFYIGNTDMDNFDRGIMCNGVFVFPRPSIIGGVIIEDCIIDTTGRGGAQISGHEVDTAIIRNSFIAHNGTQLDNQQGSSVAIGGSSKVKILNNTLKNSYTWQISSFGAYYTEIANNTLDSIGWLYPTVTYNDAVPVTFANRAQRPEYGIDSSRFRIYGNAVGRSRVRDRNADNIGDFYVGNNWQFSTNGDTWHRIGNCIAGNTYTVPNPDVQGSLYLEAGVLANTAECMGVVSMTLNASPTANAGANKSMTLPANSTTLDGTGTDPDGVIVGYTWTKISGPSTFTINSPSSGFTALTGLVQGTYIFRLTVVDNASASSSADMSVVVNGSGGGPPPANNAPTVSAGPNRNLTLPTNSTTLNGSGSDADGSVVGYSWTKIVGPSSFTLASPTAAVTALNGLTQGTYVFRLTATDNLGATNSSDVSVVVAAAVTPPVTPPAGDYPRNYRPCNCVIRKG